MSDGRPTDGMLDSATTEKILLVDHTFNANYPRETVEKRDVWDTIPAAPNRIDPPPLVPFGAYWETPWFNTAFG